MGDVKEMYHQIFVSPKDRDALRFVWRKFSTDPIEDYRMSVHIFGKILLMVLLIRLSKKQLKTKQRIIPKERLNQFQNIFT